MRFCPKSEMYNWRVHQVLILTLLFLNHLAEMTNSHFNAQPELHPDVMEKFMIVRPPWLVSHANWLRLIRISRRHQYQIDSVLNNAIFKLDELLLCRMGLYNILTIGSNGWVHHQLAILSPSLLKHLCANFGIGTFKWPGVTISAFYAGSPVCAWDLWWFGLQFTPVLATFSNWSMS